MAQKRKYKPIPRQLTAQDKEFIKLISKGEKKAVAFKMAYPDHETVTRYIDAVKDGQDKAMRQHLAGLVHMAAKNKLQTQHMQSAIVTYQSRMDILAEKSLDVAEELLQHGESEKVRADLAVEFIRHKVGTPVQKVAVREEKTVILQFGSPAPERTFVDSD